MGTTSKDNSKNLLQKILDDNALTQVQLTKATKLSRGIVNQTCRERIEPKQKNKIIIIDGINELLREKNIDKRYSIKDIFLSDQNKLDESVQQ